MTFDVFYAFIILALIMLSSFAMYLPLSVITKDRSIGLKYAIPFSISVEILIGYLFYSTDLTKYFPISYFSFALLVNIWSFYKLRPLAIKKISFHPITLFAIFVMSAIIIYTRYSDSFRFIGPGGNDAYYHLFFVKNLLDIGYLTNGFYAPGFHLFLMPVAKLIPLHDLYRFTGPAIGIVTIISFVFLFREQLKHRVLLILLLTLLVLPILNQFSLQTIYFSSTSLTFIFLGAFIFLMSENNSKERKTNLCLIIIFSSALALTVPLLFVSILPASLIAFFIVLIFKNKFGKKYPFYLLKINLIFISGIIIAFSHVFLQSNILHRYDGFPSIAAVATEATEATESSENVSETITSNEEIAVRLHLPEIIENNAFLRPMAGTLYDLLRVKNIRSINNVLSLGAYFWIAFSFFLVVFAIRKKNSSLLIVAVLSIFFGLSTQTGLFEMSFYRGRSGWYLLMLSIFGSVLFADQLYSKKVYKYLSILCVMVSCTGVFLPPTFYRSYYDKEFIIVSQLSKIASSSNLYLIAYNHQLNIVADNIIILELKPENLKNDDAFLIMEKRIFRPDPVLSQGAISTDKNFSSYNKQYEARNEQLKTNNSILESDNNFGNFKKYYEDEDFIVYQGINVK